MKATFKDEEILSEESDGNEVMQRPQKRPIEEDEVKESVEDVKKRLAK